jgi:hypothetical protein
MDNNARVAKEDITRQRSRFPSRTIVLTAVLAVVWIEILLDAQALGLVLILLGGIGITLGIIAAAMGLGFLGFGLCMAGDWVIGWLRRAREWPDE